MRLWATIVFVAGFPWRFWGPLMDRIKKTLDAVREWKTLPHAVREAKAKADEAEQRVKAVEIEIEKTRAELSAYRHSADEDRARQKMYEQDQAFKSKHGLGAQIGDPTKYSEWTQEPIELVQRVLRQRDEEARLARIQGSGGGRLSR
jgi:chromosome condensin MukBEF ATPase and DNA-binding subunit MukB